MIKARIQRELNLVYDHEEARTCPGVRRDPSGDPITGDEFYQAQPLGHRGDDVKGVSWEAEALMSAPASPAPSSGWRQLFPRSAFSHVGLLLALMLYTAGGGFSGTMANLAVVQKWVCSGEMSHSHRIAECGCEVVTFAVAFRTVRDSSGGPLPLCSFC
ncbi:hypothetical protein EVAR_4370_1 [Eumeta japonica]|uniref:Uncharacterized protein n=1 Tax=Eumeta variegata TaxID=151549 RepID=A0A4C1T0Y6_EUMVA|nr:hypothetical protein EVAR_4370_1 [Eumeta japonica]